ncbi:unnamed protein product [Echinostoma caproni]|uniref:Rhodanese domain-containing protein n=1 Tax=Echinostoma caproni TaxID=27848 RepID=A0A183AKH5_9TREM|nr:unnamed protein product [Echinostoma caproni]
MSTQKLQGTYIGRTKVRGTDYLTDGLALSVLNRQLEKKSRGDRVKFTEDSIYFPDSDGYNGQYDQEIPYDSIRKMYTFNQRPEVLMVCSDGYYDDSRIYHSFYLHNADEVRRARKVISGGYYDTRSRSRSMGYSVASRPPRTSILRYEAERPGTAAFYEPAQYRVVSRTYRTQSRSPSPIYVERTNNTTPVVERVETIPVVERVIPAKTPSPVYVQPVSTVERIAPTYTKPQEVYVTEAPAESVVYKRVSRPEGSVRTQYVTRPSTTYTNPRSTSASRYYMDDDVTDREIVLKRVSRVVPNSK